MSIFYLIFSTTCREPFLETAQLRSHLTREAENPTMGPESPRPALVAYRSSSHGSPSPNAQRETLHGCVLNKYRPNRQYSWPAVGAGGE